MSRLVLDVVDEGPPPSILGLSTSLSDVSLVFTLNTALSWSLVRYSDWRCVQPPLHSYHALYRCHFQGRDISLMWNLPEKSAWTSAPRAAPLDLFSEEASAPPLRPLLQKPIRVHGLLVIDPALSPEEMVILQRRIASALGVVGQHVLPWSILRERENFLFEQLNTL